MQLQYKEQNQPTGRKTYPLDFSRLPSGSYIVEVKSGNGAASRKVVVGE